MQGNATLMQRLLQELQQAVFSGAENEVIVKPCTLPDGVVPAQRTMLCTAFGLEIPMPSTTSIVGFICGWLAVAALIGGFLWLVG